MLGNKIEVKAINDRHYCLKTKLHIITTYMVVGPLA